MGRASDSLIRSVYARIRDLIASGTPHVDALRQYMTLLVTEIDTYNAVYPGIREVFAEILLRVWAERYPDIPPPSIGEGDSATVIYNKALQRLMEYRDQLASSMEAIQLGLSTEDARALVEREALLLVDTALRAAYRIYGLLD